MKSYKDNFYNAVDYAADKLKTPHWKLILLGVMGSVYVAIAYVAFIYIIASWSDVVNVETKEIHISGAALATAAAIFPVGILLIVFLGGSLFTSDNLTMLVVITKKHPIGPVITKWMYTLLGNLMGAILMGAILRGANVFSTPQQQLLLGYLSGKKIALEWYYTIVSAVLCNILVAGSVWGTLAAKHSSAKIMLLYFPIWLFAIVGFQHVVANGILFSMSGFYGMGSSHEYIIGGMNYATKHSWLSGPNGLGINSMGWFILFAIFSNLLPSTIGNWFSGSIILPFTYWSLTKYRKSKLSFNSKNDITDNITDYDAKHLNNLDVVEIEYFKFVEGLGGSKNIKSFSSKHDNIQNKYKIVIELIKKEDMNIDKINLSKIPYTQDKLSNNKIILEFDNDLDAKKIKSLIKN